MVPGGGIARARPSLGVRTAVGVVPNPLAPGSTIQVAINRRVDLLEQERSHRRISESAYLTGRQLQAVFERGVGAGLGEWNLDGGSGARANTDMQAVHGLMDAHATIHWQKRLHAAVGAIGAEFLRTSLAENLSFPELAERYGQSGERGVAVIAGQWRWMMEQLATAWAARGATAAPGRVYASRG